jgi:hypothetical protein
MERFELSASCSQSRRANQAALHPGHSCASLLTVGGDDPDGQRVLPGLRRSPLRAQPNLERDRADGLDWRGRPLPITNAEISRDKGCCQLADMEVAAAVGAIEIRDHSEHI